jgi:hypothetical protein
MSMSVSDDQVCLDILELLYKHLNDNPAGSGVDRAIIQDTLKLSEQQMDINMTYLENKTLVTLFRTVSSQWTFAKITADGIDVIENKERYADKFPFTQASTSQIHENVFQTVRSQVSFTQQVTDAFKQAYDQVRVTKLSTSDKEKIEKQLKALEKELQKTKKADLGAIQKNWEELKKKASWLSPAIAQVVLEGIKIALDIP